MIDDNAALEALQALEAGEAEPGAPFDFDPHFSHGFAAKHVAFALPGTVRTSDAYRALERLAAAGRVVRVRPKGTPSDPEAAAYSTPAARPPPAGASISRSS